MTETKTLQERLREWPKYDIDATLLIERVRAEETEAADALDAKDALLREAAEVLIGVIAIADRKTLEFDRARALLLKLAEAQK